MQSASATLTLQGQAIQEAAQKFGDGETLCFTPCKKGYIPVASNGERMYACPLHHKQRLKRVKKDGGRFRPGEVNLNRFWDAAELEDSSHEQTTKELIVSDEA